MYNKLKNMVSHKIKVNDFVAKLLSKEDIPAVQKFFNDNPDFFIASTGQAPKENEAEILFNKIPEGKTTEDKFWLAIFDNDNNNIVAFVDLIQNYKIENQWTIGLYIVSKNYRGQGIATKLLNDLENLLLSLRVNSLEISIKEQNVCELSFWKKMNFVEESKTPQKDFTDKYEFLLSKKLERKEPTIQEKYFKNDKLVNFPSKPAEQQEVYKIMQTWFEKDKKYSEMEINNIIKSKIECKDHVTLRRDMVDNHFLNRSGDGKEYWV